MNKAETILNWYFSRFRELPPPTPTIGYDDEIYLDLMMKALQFEKPITGEDLEKALDGVVYDIKMPTIDEIEQMTKHPKFTTWKNPYEN